jgi:hypothetical protein
VAEPQNPRRWTPATRVCQRHGRLPWSRFAPDDLRRNRRRCKTCLADKMRAWRAKHPWRTLWTALLRRARRVWGAGAVAGLTWERQGSALCARLGRGRPEPDAAAWRLAWPRRSTALDLDRVALRPKTASALASGRG